MLVTLYKKLGFNIIIIIIIVVIIIIVYYAEWHCSAAKNRCLLRCIKN